MPDRNNPYGDPNPEPGATRPREGGSQPRRTRSYDAPRREDMPRLREDMARLRETARTHRGTGDRFRYREAPGHGEPPRYDTPNRREYDGVVYEPSEYARRNARRGQYPARRSGGSASRQRPAGGLAARRQKPKTTLAFFYILTMIAGVAVCLVLFAMAFQTMTANRPAIAASPSPTAGALPVEVADLRRVTGLLTAKDAVGDSREVTLVDTETFREERYSLTDATALRNRYGTSVTFNELAVGTVMDIVFDGESLKLTQVTENARANEYRNRRDVTISLEDWRIAVGNDTYDFNSQTLVTYKGEPYPIGQIAAVDTVSFTELNKTVWNIRLESSHGYLTVENADRVPGGTLSIDTTFFRALSDVTEPLALLEGTHRVVVKGPAIEEYITDITVAPGADAVLDLADANPRTGLLRVLTNAETPSIIIDGLEASPDEPAEVPYGVHTVRVEKDGYTPVEQSVTVDAPNAEVTVNLEAIVLTSRLIVNTNVEQAEIHIDGVFAGYSTLTYELDAGPHTVSASKAGYLSKSVELESVEGDNPILIILDELSPSPIAQPTEAWTPATLQPTQPATRDPFDDPFGGAFTQPTTAADTLVVPAPLDDPALQAPAQPTPTPWPEPMTDPTAPPPIYEFDIYPP